MGTHLERDFDPAALNNVPDFWRSQPADALPDGVADHTEAINHRGLVGVGAGAPAATAPIATLDVFAAARSGVDGRVAGQTPLYVTGNLPASPGFNVAGLPTPTGGAEIRHTNQTQGFGFAFDGIYATGNIASQNFHLNNRGGGNHSLGWQALQSGLYFRDNYGGAALVANQGWSHRWFAVGTQEFGNLMRRSARANAGGVGLGSERYWQARADNGGLVNYFSMHPSKTNANTTRIEIGENRVNDDKLVLHTVDSAQFFGFGIRASELTSWISSSASSWRFRRGGDDYAPLTIAGVGSVIVDEDGLSVGVGWVNPGILRWGSATGGEGIRCPRDAASGTFQNAQIFYSGTARRFAIKAPVAANTDPARIWMELASVPVFATDALAGAGGVNQGGVFRDALGGLHIKL